MSFFGFGAGACIGDSAYITAAKEQAAAIRRRGTVDTAIQVGVALWQRNASESISNMQNDLANQQMQLAEEIHAHAILFWPEETELVNDVFSEAKVTADYNGLPLVFGTLADETSDQARTVWIDTMRTMCMSPSRCEDARWQRNSIATEVDFVSYGARQEETREQLLNDRRYARQLATIGLGRNMVGTLVSYQSVGAYSGLSAASILEQGIGSALSMYGYERQLRDRAEAWGDDIRDTWTQPARMPGTVNGTESGYQGAQPPGLLPNNPDADFGGSWRTI